MFARPFSLIGVLLAVASSLPLYRETARIQPAQATDAMTGEQSDEPKDDAPTSPSRLENIPTTGGSKVDSCRADTAQRRWMADSQSSNLISVGVRPQGLESISAPAESRSLPKVVADRSTHPIEAHAPPRA